MPTNGRPQITGVFFDLYGTLLCYGDMDRAWADWLGALYEVFHAAGFAGDCDALGRACEGLFSEPEPADDGRHTLYERRILSLATRLGLGLDEDALASAVRAPVDAWQRQVSLDPETPRLLERLSTSYALALITNFDHPPHVRRVLESLDLPRFFDAIVISGEVGVTKPDPAIFAPALEATGLEPRAVAYVGDAPEDVAAASAAGMLPIAIRREGAVAAAVVNDYGSVEPGDPDGERAADGVVVIRSLAEVEGAIA